MEGDLGVQSSDYSGISALPILAGACLVLGFPATTSARETLLANDGTDRGEAVVLCRASSHPIRYYLSLPKGYSRHEGKRWPTLVVIPGAGDDFCTAAERFRRACGERALVIACPCTFSNNNLLQGRILDRYRQLYAPDVIQTATGGGWCYNLRARLAWDEAGLCAVLNDLETDHDIEPRVSLTGFSAGGLLTYHMILNRSERLSTAVAVCSNFNFWDHQCHLPHPAGAGDHDLPIVVLTGERDPLRCYRFGGEWLPPLPWALGLFLVGAAVVLSLIGRWTGRVRPVLGVCMAWIVLSGLLVVNHGAGNDVQTAAALKLLRNSGYRRVERREVSGLGHDPAPATVTEQLPLGTATPSR